MIQIDRLKELVQLMIENDLSELDVSDSEQTVKVKRGGAVIHPATAPAHAPISPSVSESPGETIDEDDGLIVIESPMVGTFFAQANPDNPPFVSVNSDVSSETVVCLIEAMKVFNEVKAGVNGKVARILVNNGDPVEFGQKLFLINPA